ncbi:hypothetical protein GQ44DRAFT_732969 [Phaeosphaeriaceae sp. PMI808]|nr:hypothetical protein GQ44DRAFT_732969 [Phaeosphaeriaceae sp. PMI808]
MAERVRDELVARVKSLLSLGKYSDLTITCGSDVYSVHKAIVCPLSDFFEKAEMFPVGKEAAEAKIDLPDDDPEAIKLLISFFYEAEYEPELPRIKYTQAGIWTVTVPKQDDYMYDFPIRAHEAFVCAECTAPQPPDADASQLMVHARMYEVGDKYNVAGLKQLALLKFDRACAKYWDDELFAPAACHALSTTMEHDKGLRDVVSYVISEHMELLNKPEVEALLNEFNGLAVQVLKMSATKLGWVKPEQSST